MIKGVNVTALSKKVVIPYVDELSFEAKRSSICKYNL